MDLIQTDIYGKEMKFVLKANIDFEVGEEKDSINDFEVEFKRQYWTGEIKKGCRLFVEGTEFGGVVSQITSSTKEGTVKAKGYTWRGMMKKKIIEPKQGEDYATVSGETNAIIKEMVEREFPGLFYGSSEDSGATVEGHQFERYDTMHDGLAKMLKSVGRKLDIKYVSEERMDAGYVVVKAVPIMDYSEEDEFSEDHNIHFRVDDNERGVNHLICLGKGELKEREVVHLYVDKEGNIGAEQYYKGNEEIAEVYDSSGSERSDLIQNGTKKLEESKSRKEYDMTMEEIVGEMDIGDIVGGRDYVTGVVVRKPIGRKIWTVAEGKEKIEFKLKGET